MTVQACDGEKISVMTLDDNIPAVNCIFEFIGTVQEDLSIAIEFQTAYSDNFDLDVYNKVLGLAHDPKHAGMFWQE